MTKNTLLLAVVAFSGCMPPGFPTVDPVNESTAVPATFGISSDPAERLAHAELAYRSHNFDRYPDEAERKYAQYYARRDPIRGSLIQRASRSTEYIRYLLGAAADIQAKNPAFSAHLYWTSLALSSALQASERVRLLFRARALSGLSEVALGRGHSIFAGLTGAVAEMTEALASQPDIMERDKRYYGALRSAIARDREFRRSLDAQRDKLIAAAVLEGGRRALAGSPEDEAAKRFDATAKAIGQEIRDGERVRIDSAVGVARAAKEISVTDLTELQAGRAFLGAEVWQILVGCNYLPCLAPLRRLGRFDDALALAVADLDAAVDRLATCGSCGCSAGLACRSGRCCVEDPNGEHPELEAASRIGKAVNDLEVMAATTERRGLPSPITFGD